MVAMTAPTLDDTSTLAALAPEIARQTGATTVRIASAHLLAGGAVQQNWRIDAEVEDGPRAGRHAWVLRTDASARIAVSLDRETEAKVLRAAHAGGVLVAEPLAIGASGSALAKPYVVQPWLEGSAQARRTCPSGSPRRA